MKVIYVDIDETICHRETSVDFGITHDYTKAKPIVENIEKMYNSTYEVKIKGIQQSVNMSRRCAKTILENFQL